MFASFCVSPMDVSKTRLQVMVQGLKGPKPSLVAVMSDIVAKEGAAGLYAGISASLLRQAVYGTARLGLHREFSDRLKAGNGGAPLAAWQSVVSSMASGAIASVVGTPMDISLVRMQADSLKVGALTVGRGGLRGVWGRACNTPPACAAPRACSACHRRSLMPSAPPRRSSHSTPRQPLATHATAPGGAPRLQARL